jgi:hypothetical protein
MGGSVVYSENGRVEGQGQVIRKDGTVIEITLTSDPLTKEQADELNRKEQDNGSNSR